jgi:dienelactone hydrolase
MQTGTPTASSPDGQQVTNLTLPEAQAAGGELAPAGSGGAPGAEAVAPSGCVGQAFAAADPTSPGPFQVSVDRNVGPLAGFLPDPVYADVQQRFNIYRPSNLDSSGSCHPILVWANGRGDNPEQHPPECIVDPATNTWCGTYPGLMSQLASHGFVVIASLSTTTSRGEPLPTITGLNWLLEQAEDATSPYFHHLDTTRIGALGHSEGGASTCIAAADPRISAIATVSGARALTSLHGPALLICGGQDTVVSCDNVANTFNAVADQPAMFMNNLAADHGSWLGQNGSKGPTFFALTAWFRMHLMGDATNRSFFFGDDCALCTDSRVTVQRNGLMTE